MPFVLSSCPVLNTAATVVQTVGGCWLSCCPVLNTAAPVVQTAGVFAFLLSSLEHRCASYSDCGGCWCICEPMYRGPSRGTCLGSIYPTLLGFGGIQAIILSYKDEFSDIAKNSFGSWLLRQKKIFQVKAHCPAPKEFPKGYQWHWEVCFLSFF